MCWSRKRRKTEKLLGGGRDGGGRKTDRQKGVASFSETIKGGRRGGGVWMHFIVNGGAEWLIYAAA